VDILQVSLHSIPCRTSHKCLKWFVSSFHLVPRLRRGAVPPLHSLHEVHRDSINLTHRYPTRDTPGFVNVNHGHISKSRTCTVKHIHSGGQVFHLSRFFHVQPANHPTMTVVALCLKWLDVPALADVTHTHTHTHTHTRARARDC